MKQILTIIVLVFSLTSCSNRTDKKQSVKTVLNSERNQKEKAITVQQDSLLFKPDIEIEQINLFNSKNVDRYLGKDVMNRLTDNGIPYSSVFSSDLKQRLTFYFHPGGFAKEFSEFQVNYVDIGKLKGSEKITDSKEFKTESGVKLGITIETLKLIKGKPKNIINNETTILEYRIDDFKNSEFLKKYNMTVYYADYEFKGGYLIKFKFGFEYP